MGPDAVLTSHPNYHGRDLFGIESYFLRYMCLNSEFDAYFNAFLFSHKDRRVRNIFMLSPPHIILCDAYVWIKNQSRDNYESH